MNSLGKSFVAEFIGTLFLVYVGAGSAMFAGTLGAVGVALSFGFIIAAMIYAFGNVSGCHINPAVTIALWVHGAIKFKRVVVYLVAQILGGLVGALFMLLILKSGADVAAGGDAGLGVTGIGAGVSPMVGMMAEALGTFALVLVVFCCAVGKIKSQFVGLSVGMVVAGIILSAGGVSGSSLNPARSIGPALVSGNVTNLWIYIVGPILGGILASLVFRYLDDDSRDAG